MNESSGDVVKGWAKDSEEDLKGDLEWSACDEESEVRIPRFLFHIEETRANIEFLNRQSRISYSC
jgi:hypothetical protein